MNILAEEDRINLTQITKGEKFKFPKLNYFIEKEKLNFLFNFAVNSFLFSKNSYFVFVTQ